MKTKTNIKVRCTCKESKILHQLRRTLQTPEGASVVKHAKRIMAEHVRDPRYGFTVGPTWEPTYS
jgi:hypothetical protein